MKRKLYLVLSILAAVFILSSAAICNLGNDFPGGVSGNEIAKDENQSNSSSDDPKKDSTNKSTGSDSTGSAGAEAGNKDSKDSKSTSKEQNNPPVINSIKLDNNKFFPNSQYSVTCDVTDPDNDNIFYNWATDGGLFDQTESAAVIWTAPGTNGIFDIVLNVSDGWGGSDSMTETVTVGMVPKNAPPVIDDIAVYPDGGKYTDKTYEIWCYNTDPNNSVINFDFKISGGVLHDQDANIIKWDTPNASGTYTVTVTVTDKEGNIVKSSKDIVVEQQRIEITDIIVKIDYIASSRSYYIEGVIVDPQSQINQYIWSTTGGDVSDQIGYTAVWNTPGNPGTYSLTLTATTFGGNTITRKEEFVVNPPQ